MTFSAITELRSAIPLSGNARGGPESRFLGPALVGFLFDQTAIRATRAPMRVKTSHGMVSVARA
jgi:hypothetical protein